MRVRSSNKSGYFGVFQRGHRFVAIIGVSCKNIQIGRFTTAHEAALAYDKYAIENKLSRRLNFPDPEPENLVPNTRLIRLTQGKFAVVDEEDFEYLNQWQWNAHKAGRTFYAVRYIVISGNRTKMKMHWAVMKGKGADHIDHNGLHNWRSNLRFCTQQENCMNTTKRKNTSSIYKGVSLDKQTGKWEAYIAINHKKINLGFFNLEIDAARAYNEKAIELFGDFACLNDV